MDIGNGWNVEIDKLSLPLGADLERDTPWGTDELGFKQFRTATGKIYSLRPQSPIAPQTQGGSLARVKDVIGSMVRGAFESAKAGVTAPGRALMGEPVTVGDVFNTAGMAAVGSAGMAAPKGALRMGALRSSDDVATRGAEIMDYLRGGRAADVTDDMLDMGNAADNAALNDWLNANYDLPMDDASRLGRASSLGFGTDAKFYHGSDESFAAFDPARQRDPGVWTTTDMRNAANYVRGNEGELYKLYGRNARPADVIFDYGDSGNLEPFFNGNPVDATSNEAIVKDLFGSGYDTVNFPAGNFTESDYTRVFKNPADLRSVSARFDPRLAHLRNLMAGIGGLGLMLPQSGNDPQQR